MAGPISPPDVCYSNAGGPCPVSLNEGSRIILAYLMEPFG